MKDYKNILVRMPNWLGDVVMATPVLQDIRTRWPSARITAMCQSNVAPLLAGNPYIDEIFSYKRPNEFLRRISNRDVILRLRQGNYDLGLLLTNSFSSALLLWRGKVAHRIGFATDGRGFLLTSKVPVPEAKGREHLVDTYKRLLRPLGCPPSDSSPHLFITDQERRLAKNLLKLQHVPEDATLIGINPGAAFGSAKCWLPERFREVTEKLLKNPSFYIAYFGDPAGAALVKSICEGMPERVVNFAGLTTLRELMALTSLCNVFLSNDSGPMHIAAALKVPLVALFGSTNEVATGPYKHGTVIHKHVSCSPCYKKVCPIDFKCMKQIQTDEVYEEVIRLLET